MFIASSPPHGGSRRAAGRRSGLSLVVVMLALSTSLIVTMSFVQTQNITQHLTGNAAEGALLQAAAQSGATAALQRMRSADWAGVEEVLTAELTTDSSGSVGYQVEFLPVTADDADGQQNEEENLQHALQVRIRSVGRRLQPDGTPAGRQRVVELIVRLEPRVPGRTLVSGDEADVSDLAANPGDYDAIQQYALFASDSSTSLSLDPETCIEGPMRLRKTLNLFRGVHWSSSIRSTYQKAVGQRLGGGGLPIHPHPLNGAITFQETPSSSIQSDITDLQRSWSVDNSSLSLPPVTSTSWRTYQLYDGGFTYSAVEIGASLSSITLRPTATNPLGVFYRTGNVQINSDVRIEGTLFATGRVELRGSRIVFSSARWRNASGEQLTDSSSLWPRLPVLVADEITSERDAQVLIDGAVVTSHGFSGQAGDYDLPDISANEIFTTATAVPLAAPFSRVQLDGSQDLTGLTSNQQYSLWLDNGGSGHWYPITAVDASVRQLTVAGEVEISSPVSCRVARTLRRYVNIRGPLSGDSLQISRTAKWESPSSFVWSLVRYYWGQYNDYRQYNGDPPVGFDEYVASNEVLVGWSGLPLDPTFHLQYAGEKKFRWSPPLFRAWNSTTEHVPHSGYRWTVVSWREVP